MEAILLELLTAEDRNMKNVQLVKLNKDYQSDPNIANPRNGIEINGQNLILSFELNPYIFNFEEGEIGTIVFYDCYSYRVGSPNDEGFSLSDNELWNNKNFSYIEWDCFYEVQNAPKSYLEKFTKLNKAGFDKRKLKHYVFFMKDGTFECLAENYSEKIPVR